ncbi:MAG: DUF362 domain-containing protein [Methanobacteriaceae archaeon]
MVSKVYFSNLRTRSGDDSKGNKLARLFDTANFGSKFSEDDLVPVKIHFGERGNDGYISPTLTRYIIDKVKETGAKPFLTDTNTLYFGERHNGVDHFKTAMLNGFSYSVVGVPVIIADGIRSENESIVGINKKYIKEAKIASDILSSDAMVVSSHFKGHELSGFGGAIKNLAMGCATIAGKLDQHGCAKPKITDDCTRCGACIPVCPIDVINMVDSEVEGINYDIVINEKDCVACMNCYASCPNEAVDLDWEEEIPEFIERMCEYAYAAVKNKKDKVVYFNFLTNITPDCDCLPFSDAQIVPDIGFLASTDPVAIDAASLYLVNQEKGIKNTMIHKNCHPGEDKFHGVWEKVDGTRMLEYCEELGMGTRDFDLIEI